MGFKFTKDERPTMDNFNKKFSELSYKVGDTLTTARTELDDKWLLCNGEDVSVHDYSELSEMFPTLLGAWKTNEAWSGSLADPKVNCITYANGYWVVGGRHYDGTNYYARIAYTNDITGTWKTKDLWGGTSSQYHMIRCVTYSDGYWVVGGQQANGASASATGTAKIAYSTDLNGMWETKDIWSNNYASFGGGINSITYSDGYWVAGGLQYAGSYNAAISYTTDLGGIWTQKNLWSGRNSSIERVINEDGFWMVVGYHWDGSNYYSRIAYTEDVISDWTIKDLWTSKNSNNGIYCVAYSDGYWVLGGTHYDGKNQYARIAYTKDISSDWTIKDLWFYANYAAIRGIVHENGFWVACGYDNAIDVVIAYTINLEEIWTLKNIGTGNSYDLSIEFGAGYWAVCSPNSINSVSRANVIYKDISTFTLPTISSDKTYTYIKAKED